MIYLYSSILNNTKYNKRYYNTASATNTKNNISNSTDSAESTESTE